MQRNEEREEQERYNRLRPDQNEEEDLPPERTSQGNVVEADYDSNYRMERDQFQSDDFEKDKS